MFNFRERYSKQILFEPIGEKGQKKLKESRITIIGCGGLGSVLASNMVRAGIGFLRIVDRDRLELSNLQRQVLFDEEDICEKLPKVIAAEKKLRRINSEVEIEAVFDQAEFKNIKRFVSDVDLVLDGTDNFPTRYIINKACVESGTVFIYGAVAASNGMVYTVIPGSGICLKCIFPKEPPLDATLNCNNVGIINTAVNVIASIQSTEALKYLTENLKAMIKGLINLDLWDLSLDILEVKKDKEFICPVCDKT